MQATLDLAALKRTLQMTSYINILTLFFYLNLAFTRALACLSRYGDDLVINANPDSVLIQSVNSAKSAYCSFEYKPEFFSRYSFGSKSRREQGFSARSRSIPMRAGGASGQTVNGGSGSGRTETERCCYQVLTRVCCSDLYLKVCFLRKIYDLQALLSILKQRSIEKSLEKCEISIVEGSQDSRSCADEDVDSLESKLVIRLHCKNGTLTRYHIFS